MNEVAKYAKRLGALAYAAKLASDMADCWNQCDKDPCGYDY
jgi:hypothetical protein